MILIIQKIQRNLSSEFIKMSHRNTKYPDERPRYESVSDTQKPQRQLSTVIEGLTAANN